jgi:accessory gene regulator protein AgrB
MAVMHNGPGRHAQSQAECVHNSAGTHAQRPAVSMHFPTGVRTTLALYIIVAMFGFNFIPADIAANGVFDNQYESSFVKSSCIR